MGDKIGNRRGCREPSVRCAAAAAIAAVLALVGAARADDYPSRSVHVIIPFGPGGVTDIVSRVLFDAMAKVLGQAIVIENRAGASGTIATEFVADAPPDGYTLLVDDPSGPLATGVSLYASRRIDQLTRLEPIAPFGTTGAVLVVAVNFPAQTLADFVALAKQKPGELLYGLTGIGTPGHLNGALLDRIVGIDARHVPLAAVLPYIQSGQLRALAAAGEHHLRELPNLPTVKESGCGDYDVSTMYALFAPRGTASDIVGVLKRATDQVLNDEDVASVSAKPASNR